MRMAGNATVAVANPAGRRRGEAPKRAGQAVPRAAVAEGADEKVIADTINSVRFLAIDAVQKASSGHPGLPMGSAAAGYLLFKEFMHLNPDNTSWFNRDRFILSAGHGCMLQYALMHLSGFSSVPVRQLHIAPSFTHSLPFTRSFYPMLIITQMDEIKNFRQFKSKCPGHPENFETDGVEATTGPLGTGISTAVGLAAAEKHLASRFNKPDNQIVDHYTYVISGDGDCMEGCQQEAISWAGHQGLGKLIVLYDDNNITIDGHTDLAFSEDVLGRYAACGWHTQHVRDGSTDISSLRSAIQAAKDETERPSIIKMTTLIGFGSPNKANTHDVHGAPLGEDEVSATREALGWPYGEFEVPDSAYQHMSSVKQDGQRSEQQWNQQLEQYKSKYPEDAQELMHFVNDELPADWESYLPTFSSEDKPLATRHLSQAVLNALAPGLPGLVGGSADLAPSNMTLMKMFGDMQNGTPAERNMRFGVREFGMSLIANGLSLHKSGLVPYAATFTIFTDFMRGGMRLSALQRQGVIYVTTHDSIGLGEDGPTHQPVEQLSALRAMPGMHVMRPADGNEVSGAYKVAVNRRNGPTVMALSRQKVPNLENTSIDKVAYGAYSVYDTDSSAKPHVIAVATGSEVSIALEACQELETSGNKVRCVSFPCWELFDKQSAEYKESVLPSGVPKVSLEAGTTYASDLFLCFLSHCNAHAAKSIMIYCSPLSVYSQICMEQVRQLQRGR